MTKHLEPITVYALLDGELDSAEERAAEAHLLRCDACRALREQCAGTLGSLRWYAGATPKPPAGYWDGFWARLEARISAGSRGSGAGRTRPIRRAWRAPALAAAAVAGLLVGAWWAYGPDPDDDPATPARTVAVRAVVADTGWESDVEFFERATVAIGSVDPLSKGIVLASMAESE